MYFTSDCFILYLLFNFPASYDPDLPFSRIESNFSCKYSFWVWLRLAFLHIESNFPSYKSNKSSRGGKFNTFPQPLILSCILSGTWWFTSFHIFATKKLCECCVPQLKDSQFIDQKFTAYKFTGSQSFLLLNAVYILTRWIK